MPIKLESLPSSLSYLDLEGNVREMSLYQKVNGYHQCSITEKLSSELDFNPLLGQKGINLRGHAYSDLNIDSWHAYLLEEEKKEDDLDQVNQERSLSLDIQCSVFASFEGIDLDPSME